MDISQQIKDIVMKDYKVGFRLSSKGSNMMEIYITNPIGITTVVPFNVDDVSMSQNISKVYKMAYK